MKFIKSCLLFICLVLTSVSANAAIHVTAFFKITEIYVSSATNMHLRVSGMGDTLPCAAAPGWAYVNGTDDGAETKISALMTAYHGKKNVSLIVEPRNFYSNGAMFCNILEVRVTD